MGENYVYCPHRGHVQKNGPGRTIPMNDGRTLVLCRACNLKFLLTGKLAWSTGHDELQGDTVNA